MVSIVVQDNDCVSCMWPWATVSAGCYVPIAVDRFTTALLEVVRGAGVLAIDCLVDAEQFAAAQTDGRITVGSEETMPDALARANRVFEVHLACTASGK